MTRRLRQITAQASIDAARNTLKAATLGSWAGVACMAATWPDRSTSFRATFVIIGVVLLAFMLNVISKASREARETVAAAHTVGRYEAMTGEPDHE